MICEFKTLFSRCLIKLKSYLKVRLYFKKEEQKRSSGKSYTYSIGLVIER